ncbi:DUF4369 domain-containing protein [Flavobacterium columnare NBRC 100251 = ATCC 23463]|uniref:DUF4369 domain-containing protein n=2 Tax=Flavobacterium columnare TaxID=996 RepID=G8X8J5_FLACA|nr:DUF4369 domain-containing protein [Flavobacterium columnare]AEW85829.1 hypothetical protein FCOL_05010 [Flavobacterium columnare ATCC 49512]AMO19022.1 DUF4369 domain-containing protein [Flavobacterium columnare]ANO47946.1 hypothetical protein Pf1_02492 [Flavobacterium columnare]APT21472.1 hypothetical protein BU993_01740 [Flavobacterium columnare]MBF6652326.1 DUF4369 domain-containing protein [Flavobacterium columnare]
MYKKVIVAITFVFFASCADKAPAKDEVIVTGNIKGLKKGKLYIQKVQDSTLVALDTIELNGSSNFESSIKLDSPEMLYLFVDRGQTNSMDNNLLFFAEPGKITIDTDLDFFFANAKITGSKNHDLYKEYKDIIAKFNEQQLQLLQAKILGNKGNKNYNELDNQNKQDQLLKRKYLYSANFALTHADHEIAPYIALTDIYDMQPKFLEEIHKKMSPEVANSKYGKKFTDYLKKSK